MNLTISQNRSKIVAVSFSDTHILLTFHDGRLFGVPLDWYPAVKDASADERTQYTLYMMAVVWKSLDEVIDLDALMSATYNL